MTNFDFKSLFNSKEHYLEFIKAWKSYVNDPETCGNLRKEHYALYNILRNKDHRKCFTPITNKNKLDNGCRKYQAFEYAMDYVTRWARKCESKSTWEVKYAQELLAPFGRTVDLDMLKALGQNVSDKFEK